jgi:hypothetical protein
MPVRNGFAQASAYTRSAVGGLWGKLAGRPGTYQGLWELLRLFYGSVKSGDEPPISPEKVANVNNLVWELLAGEPDS